jgi:hypothetical protein
VSGQTGAKRLSDMLRTLTETEESDERITLAEIVTRLGDQARGVLMVLFALPNCLPSPPGTSAVTGLPLVFLTLQMALNIRPWLPRGIGRRSVSREGLRNVLTRADPWLRRVEKLVHPRLGALTSDTAERLVGFLGLFLALTIMLPIPLGNMLPALALVAFSLGFIGLDGAWVLIGALLAGLSALLVAAAGWAAFLALMQIAVGWLEF